MENTVQVNVADMSAARDARRELQAAMLRKHASPLICFTMNIPGPVKRDDIIDRAFEQGAERIRDQLRLRHTRVLDVRKKIAPTGSECVWAVDHDPAELKSWMCKIENDGEIGRLYDIDVMDAAGEKLSRGIARRCLICGQEAFICARSRAHSWQELSERAHEIIKTHFDREHARRLAMLAQRALLHEAVVTPKPGLVDRENSGSHRDMNLFTLMDSACELRPFFEGCAGVGIECRGDIDSAYDRISFLGVQAEAEMLKVCHTNAHKGALFSLGILTCAAAMAGEGGDIDAVLKITAEIAKHSLARLETMDAPATGGEAQYRQYGYTGARGEAAAGFPTVRYIALPALAEAKERGLDENGAGVHALLALIAAVRDSNILRRGGMDALKAAMGDAENLLSQDYSMESVRAMNDRFVEMNISPGGSADLLSAAFFLQALPLRND